MPQIAVVVRDASGRQGTLRGSANHDSRSTVFWSNGETSNVPRAALDEIGEIEYEGEPHQQTCHHSSCLNPLAVYWNIRNDKWYCSKCAAILNSGGKIVCFPING